MGLVTFIRLSLAFNRDSVSFNILEDVIMRQGKYTVVGSKYVHESKLRTARAVQVIKGIMVAVVVVTLGYMAAFAF